MGYTCEKIRDRNCNALFIFVRLFSDRI